MYRRSRCRRRPTRRSQRLSAISGAGRGRRPFILTRRRWRQRLRRRRYRRCLGSGFLAGVTEEVTLTGGGRDRFVFWRVEGGVGKRHVASVTHRRCGQ